MTYLWGGCICVSECVMRQSFSLSRSSPNKADWLVSKVEGILLPLTSRHWNVRLLLPYSSFHLGVRDVNSDLLTWEEAFYWLNYLLVLPPFCFCSFNKHCILNCFFQHSIRESGFPSGIFMYLLLLCSHLLPHWFPKPSFFNHSLRALDISRKG